mmetsp:Transcript_93047/g.262315  ORF Transcript_93047/g.262315 Transcript_93047/m.262315 type:complete len:1047 (+) Transcript_93047:1-3141(+)
MTGDIWHRTRDVVRDVMRDHATKMLRYVDLWTLTLQIPEDCLGGHQSPMSATLTWQIFLGGICPHAATADGSLASFHGDTCRAAQVNVQCADLTGTGFHYAWECALAKPCDLRALPQPPGMRRARLERGVVVVDLDAAGEMPERRTWFESSWKRSWAWTLVVCTSVAGLALSVKVHPWEGRYRDGDGYWRMAGMASVTTHSEADGEKGGPVTPRGPQGTVRLNYPVVDAEQSQISEAHVMVGSSSKTAASPSNRSEDGGAAATASGAPPAGEKFAFGLARCVASLHVVAGHLYARQAIADVYIFGWGFTWVPWFFMLSGFILFSAEARRPRAESVLGYVARRSVSIYPLYGASLLVACVLAKAQDASPGFLVLLLQAWLGQAWLPWVTEGALQMQCWFLSCMVVYWALFRVLYLMVASLKTLGHLLIALAIACALPWIAVVIVPAIAGDLRWYDRHTFGHTESLDLAVVFLKFNPLCYIHIFFVGMALARLRDLLEPHSKKATLVKVMHGLAPAGYLGLLLLFSVPALHPPAAKLSARLSILLPLQAAVLLGLAGLPGAEPTAMASKVARLNFLEGYSYAVYVMQFICYHVWPESKVGLGFFVFLILSAVLAVHLVQKPAERLCSRFPDKLWIAPLAVSAMLGALCLVPDAERNGDIPAWRELEDMVVDLRLPLHMGSGSGRLINPSLLFRKDGTELVLTARRHGVSSERSQSFYDGRQVTLVEDTWHSEIIIGVLNVDELSWNAWLKGGTPMKLPSLSPWAGLRTVNNSKWNNLCVRERWIPENNTLSRLVVTGPEDARVFQRFPDVFGAPGVDVAFNSYPPLGRYGCGKDGAVSQMYLTEGVDPSAPRSPSFGMHLDCGEPDRAEKNWIPFQREGRLHFVYSIQPHVIAEVQAGGRCSKKSYSSFAPLVRLQARQPGLALRGSAQAVLVEDVDATPRLPKPHFLALMHIVDPKTRRYAHFAYRFRSEAPFEVLQVSSQLPLQAAAPEEGGQPFAFASGLALHGQQVVITYAAGDRDPRALVMPLQRLDVMFGDNGANSQDIAFA